MGNNTGTHNDSNHTMPCQCNRNTLWLQSLRSPCGPNCSTSTSTKSLIGPGLTTAVIDDANEVAYIYGNILHENYHVPEDLCLPYFTVSATAETFRNRNYLWGHELFEGVYSGDNIVLQEKPDVGWPTFVFRNGLKQREGQEYEYTLTDRTIHFNFHPLEATDFVEVHYRYVEGA